ncbi:hypothetical protein G6F57_015949 [Rhizopus arrhizus]|nr:hypothetical protein G6F57_015949 [Rhizopus arrhizus]
MAAGVDDGHRHLIIGAEHRVGIGAPVHGLEEYLVRLIVRETAIKRLARGKTGRAQRFLEAFDPFAAHGRFPRTPQAQEMLSAGSQHALRERLRASGVIGGDPINGDAPRLPVEEQHRDALVREAPHIVVVHGGACNQAVQGIPHQPVEHGLDRRVVVDGQQDHVLARAREGVAQRVEQSRRAAQGVPRDQYAHGVGSAGDERAGQRVGRVAQARRRGQHDFPRFVRDVAAGLKAARNGGLRNARSRGDVVGGGARAAVFGNRRHEAGRTMDRVGPILHSNALTSQLNPTWRQQALFFGKAQQ